ncbi:hypothetical protein [Enterococcus faecium]|uniref:hypothetical protein n=1 Tax=Enterococcus faecium TaxID=1352 RepID=UPI00103CB397|nr:hypothetical protein [Enterococcus faecium]MBK4838671.1 hypothetical protein [Enterococcus faecium]MBK4854792.1 hypothetical protein [Enterococcus faecium]MBK4878916.1 hypothetical protein [Enterococcus faecium]MCO5417967.1 hypothetical protein [Enterococcus faecium]NRE81283.1 hypothetical protein [Enterococcus faecium]
MKVYLSNIINKEKPDQYKVKKISNTILNNLRQMTIQEFAEELSVNGKTVVLAELSEKKLSKMTPIVGQEVVMLDFDNKYENNLYTIEDLEADSFMQENASFIYRTFSDIYSEIDKFRVVFHLDKLVTENQEIEQIYQSLFKKYPQADSSVGQTNRLFFGSNSGYEVIDWDNRLDTTALLKIENTKTIEVVGTFTGEIIDEDLPNYLLLKYKGYEIVKNKFGDNYKQEFPDDYNAMNYFKSLDMREFLELPDGNPFLDILHEEDNPSASVFYAEEHGIYLYKCFSSSNKYCGNIIALLERYLKISSIEVVNLLVELTGSNVTNTSQLGQSKFNAQKFKRELQSGELKQTYPELYQYFSKYQVEIPIVLDFMYDYVYMDDNGKLRYLNYYSIKNLAKQLARVTNQKKVSLDRTRKILYHMIVTEIVKKKPEAEIPKDIFNDLILEQKKDCTKLRTSNIYEPTNLTDENTAVSEGIAKVLRENKVTVGSLSYELVYRLFGEEKAYQDFPQSYKPLVEQKKIKMSKTDSNLSQASEKLEKASVRIIMNEIEEKGYVYEKDVISKLAKARRLKVRDTAERFKKLRADIYNKYGLKTCRLTKELYNQLEIKEKYSSKNVIYKVN